MAKLAQAEQCTALARSLPDSCMRAPVQWGREPAGTTVGSESGSPGAAVSAPNAAQKLVGMVKIFQFLN